MSLTCIHIPVANGRQYNSGSTDIPLVGNVDDTNISKWRAQFDPIVEQKLHFIVPAFGDYSSGGVIRLRWRGNATSGDVAWKMYYNTFTSAGGASSQTGNTGTTASTVTTINSTANALNETVLTIPSGLGADVLLGFTISRDAASVSDTCTVATDLLDLQFEYTCNTAISKEFLWVPVKAMNISSTATLTSLATITSNNNVIDTFNFPSSSTVDFKINIPSNFSSALKWGYWVYHTNSFATSTERLDMAAVSVGGSGNPSLTTGTNQTKTNNSSTSMGLSTAAACDVQPTTGQEVYCKLVCVTPATGTEQIIGVVFEYAASTRNPGTIRLDPNSGNYGSTGGMTLAANTDSNSTKLVARAASGGVDNKVDFTALIPSIWASGGTLRVRWRSPASSGNGYFRVDSARVTSSGSTDPTLTTGTATAYTTAGANLINEFTVDLSTGLNANDTLWIRLNRLGSSGSDTLSNTVDIVEVVFEANIT